MEKKIRNSKLQTEFHKREDEFRDESIVRIKAVMNECSEAEYVKGHIFARIKEIEENEKAKVQKVFNQIVAVDELIGKKVVLKKGILVSRKEIPEDTVFTLIYPTYEINPDSYWMVDFYDYDNNSFVNVHMRMCEVVK